MNSLMTMRTVRDAFLRSGRREELVHVGERLEFERVAERIEEEHRRLLARLPGEANVRLDDELGVRLAKARGEAIPRRTIGDDAEMAHGHLLSIDEAGGVAHRARVDLVRDDLVPEEIEVDPVVAAAAFGAAEELPVEAARQGQVGDGEREVEARIVPGRYVIQLCNPHLRT